MPGALNKQLPNRALSGPELAAISKLELAEMMQRDPAFSADIAYKVAAYTIVLTYVLPVPHPKHELKSRAPRGEGPELTGSLLQTLILEEFNHMVPRDFIFSGSGAYRSTLLNINLVVHLGDPHEPGTGKSMVTGEAPIPADYPGLARTSVIGLERVVKLENPNIDRISHGLPIIVQRATPPTPMVTSQLPGEPPIQTIGAPGVENLEFRYDATQFEKPAPPVDTDISQIAAAKLGVPVQTGF